ncbi:hypothetical protein DFS34DRAFT_648129 [Phlyctochytrium arcticum]|nr:hypothetical protein DFS34DRAFT_648129 [Phlyctochytrium arcticum]
MPSVGKAKSEFLEPASKSKRTISFEDEKAVDSGVTDISSGGSSMSGSDDEGHRSRHPSPARSSSPASSSPASVPAPAPAQEFFENALMLGSHALDFITDENSVLSNADLSDDAKKAKITTMFIKAAASLDLPRVEKLLTNKKCRNFIDIDKTDEEGFTALTYAAALGSDAMMFLLLDQGANTDITDKNGWTPLVWACTNSNISTSRILIERGAKRDVYSNSGRSIRDLLGRKVNHSNKRIIRLLNSNDDNDDGGFDDTESLASMYDNGSDMFGTTQSEDNKTMFEEEEGEPPVPFDWNTCPYDQMLVFDPENMDGILDAIVWKLWTLWLNQNRSKTKRKPLTPASLLFLHARYAHHYHGPQTLQKYLNQVVDHIIDLVRANRDNCILLSYWIANCTQLLYYLKRDSNLVLSSLPSQATISELIHELFAIFIQESQARLASLVQACLVDHDSSDEHVPTDRRAPRSNSPNSTQVTSGSPRGVVFENFLIGKASRGQWDWRSIARSFTPDGSARAKRQAYSRTPPPVQTNPRTVTTFLTQILHILNRTQNHPHIINRTFHQLFYCLSVTLFNTILTTSSASNPLSKSGSLRIRLNLSVVQDWTRDVAHTHIPSSGFPLARRFTPVMHLTKFLGILTSLTSMDDFLEIKSCPGVIYSLTFFHLRRVVENYRYEVGESTIPMDLVAYVSGMCDSLTASAATHKPDFDDDSTPTYEEARPELMELTPPPSLSASPDCGGPATPTISPAEDEREGLINPIKTPLVDLLDPSFMLPFQVPSFTDDDEEGSWGMDNPRVDAETMKFIDE